MDATNVGRSARRERPARRTGVGSRLGFAFAAAGAIVVAAAGAGLHALDAVGARLETVHDRVPRALAAGAASRSAERVAAAAPALLAAPDRERFAAVAAGVRAELDRLDDAVRSLGGEPDARSRARAERLEALGERLATLESLVADRMAASGRVAALRRALFAADAELERLLAPWIAITDDEASAVVARAGGPVRRVALAVALDRRDAVREAGRRIAEAVRLLAESSTAEDATRLAVLDFQLDLALSRLDAAGERLDPRLRTLFDERVARLHALADGTGSIAATRRRELALASGSEAALERATALSAELAAAVARFGAAAGRDVDEAVERALAMRRTSGHVLVALVAPALLGALLLVWLQVRRRVARPLGALADAMLDIASGRLDSPVATAGHDEVAAMGRAVETFRRHALERDALLGERARAAERLEAEVRGRTAELRTADAFKTRFLAAASHDLRQPLHALTLFVAQLRDAADAAERRRLTDRIDVAVGTVNELFGSLLHMSRLEAGALEPEVRAFPIGPLLDRLETTFAEGARERGLRLRVVPSDAAVATDAALLWRVLQNLVANAIGHTDAGAVLVGCRRRGDRLRIDVRDSGPGIAPERRADAFEEFRRLRPERVGREAGLGLGLAIVERLAALLRCPVELRSEVGRGSRFSVSVPLAARVADAPVPRDADVHRPFDPLPGRLAVVIDDDEGVLEATRGLLRGWGCTVLTATSAATAVAGLAGRVPDLLVVDCALPDGPGGSEAIAALRLACGSDVPAFLISGDTSPGRREEARAGGHELLHKPLSPMAMRAASTRVLRASRTGPGTAGTGPG